MQSYKTKIWMLAIILLMQIILPTLTIVVENGITIKSIAATTEWDISATEEDNVKAVFDDETGTLTISGTGKMKGWMVFLSVAPWNSIREKITEVIIEEGVTSIGNYAFSDCSGLREITIPDSVTNIGINAFENCSNLTSIVIPDNVTIIGTYAFFGCNSLTSIEVDEKNQNYSSEKGVLYDKVKRKLINYPLGKTETEFEIPSSVTSIEIYAFSKCSSLREITIPAGVTSIGSYAFSDCSGLREITIPAGVTSITKGLFRGCSNLTKITIPTGITSIGSDAFSNCSSLTEIAIPTGVTRIESDTFSNCSSLTEIAIPTGVTIIGGDAFSNCSSLKEITIPDNVILIGSRAFENCSSLTEITVVEENTNYSSENGVLYNKDKTTIECYPAGKAEISFEIPSSVTSISKGVFSGCSNLTEIAIPAGVTIIGSDAFSNCSSLTKIEVNTNNEKYSSESGILYNKDKTKIICYPAGKAEISFEIPSSVTSIEHYVFCDCSSLREIIIPEGVTSIGIYAFSNCSSLKEIAIPTGVTSIGSCAFSNCSSLIEITIPEGITSIGSSAFMGCENLTIYCYEDSYAHTYAENNEINYVLIEKNNYEVKENNGIYYLGDINPNVTFSDLIETVKTEGTIAEEIGKAETSSSITIYKGSQEITEDDEKIVTNMTMKVVIDNTETEYVITVNGDVNGDGEANIRDILAINKHRLNKTPLTGAYLLAGNVTEDENVDIMDILQINKYRLGKIRSL